MKMKLWITLCLTAGLTATNSTAQMTINKVKVLKCSYDKTIDFDGERGKWARREDGVYLYVNFDKNNPFFGNSIKRMGLSDVSNIVGVENIVGVGKFTGTTDRKEGKIKLTDSKLEFFRKTIYLSHSESWYFGFDKFDLDRYLSLIHISEPTRPY